jgi:hypothetical protein
MQIVSSDQEVDLPHLTDLLQKALGRPALKIIDWKVKPIMGGLEFESAVFRFQGEARDNDEIVSWSLILKVIKSSEKAIEPAGIWYWKREALGYQSGLLDQLPGGNVTAPACYEAQERPDGSMCLWLEDIKEDVPNPWPIEQYGRTARQLGQFNGAYLTGQSIPTETWIPRNWLRMYVEHAEPMAEFMRSNPYHPVVMHIFPGDTVAQMLAFWDERDTILDVLENLPQVFCHQDAFRRNLFARQGKTVSIDWAYMGNAAIGAELVALVAGSIGFFEIPAERVKELDHLCFEAYLQGLADAGWKGDPKLVRTGYVVSCMLRYPIGGSMGEMLPKFIDQDAQSKLRVAAAFDGKSAEDLEKSDPAIVAYYQGLMPEALKNLGIKRLVPLFGRMAGNIIRLRVKRGKQV